MESRQKVIIADDERAVRDLLETIFSESYDVNTASDGKQALDTYLTSGDNCSPARAVITDRQMPGKDGFYLASEIRKYDPDIPIVMLSGGLSQQDIERAYSSGITHIEQKPIKDFIEFKSNIDKLVLDYLR
ncbi:response regulator [Candidatus Woesearchaeota archaeon]|nr:response regulator [Candidatus Woesearchaeota archaeon]